MVLPLKKSSKTEWPGGKELSGSSSVVRSLANPPAKNSTTPGGLLLSKEKPDKELPGLILYGDGSTLSWSGTTFPSGRSPQLANQPAIGGRSGFREPLEISHPFGAV